jgi:hypothetical protein
VGAPVIDTLTKLKDFVPLFQSILWMVFSLALIVAFRRIIVEIKDVVIERIRRGSSFKAGPIEVGEAFKNLQYADQMPGEAKTGADGSEREKRRLEIYRKNRSIFLTHILVPSKRKGYRYDVYIYLIRHKSKDFSDIAEAEFFFGHMWGNKVFKVKNEAGIVGISTSAYAPFLCTCCLKFTDGVEIELSRYIDFEMKRVKFPEIARHVV